MYFVYILRVILSKHMTELEKAGNWPSQVKNWMKIKHAAAPFTFTHSMHIPVVCKNKKNHIENAVLPPYLTNIQTPPPFGVCFAISKFCSGWK